MRSDRQALAISTLHSAPIHRGRARRCPSSKCLRHQRSYLLRPMVNWSVITPGSDSQMMLGMRPVGGVQQRRAAL